jgi:hypothetical protein
MKFEQFFFQTKTIIIMKTRVLFLYLILIVISNNTFSQISKNEIKTISKELVGEYEFYIEQELLYINFRIWEKNGVLMCQDQFMPEATKIKPVEDEHLKFKMKRMGAIQYLQFFSDSTKKITEAKFIATKKREYWGKKLNDKSAKHLVVNKIFSVDTLKDELKQLKVMLEKNHPAPYMFISKKEFNKVFQEQMAKIDHPMDVREFYNISAPLISMIGCGHTQIELPEKFWEGKNNNTFPVELIFIDDKAYVQSFYQERAEIPIGSEIISVNSIPIQEIIHSAKSIISSDGKNETWKYVSLSDEFGYYYTILYGASETFKIEYKDAGKKGINSTTLKSKKFWELTKNSKVTSTGDPNLDFEILQNKNLAVLTISSLEYYDKTDEFRVFLDSTFKEIKKQKITNLILDVRGNVGGDPICTAMLLSYLQKEATPFFKKVYAPQYAYLAKPIPVKENYAFNGELYVLINGGCASSTGFLCALLKYNNTGTFIGEETAGTYECNDSHYSHYTKETRLNIKLAHITFTTAAKGISREHGIKPDYPVKPKINDVINGDDTVKEFAYSLINNSDK